MWDQVLHKDLNPLVSERKFTDGTQAIINRQVIQASQALAHSKQL
jgi:hypothetical protein